MKNVLDGYEYQRNLTPEQFANMTDWLLQWQAREKDRSFSVVLIEFPDVGALGDALGAKLAAELIRRVEAEVIASLRNTDMMCRVRASTFWVLLPQGHPGAVVDRLDPILSAAREDGLDASHLTIAKLTVSPTEKLDAHALRLFERVRAVRDQVSRPRRDPFGPDAAAASAE
jgi:GGDEF domain-containing protein